MRQFHYVLILGLIFIGTASYGQGDNIENDTIEQDDPIKKESTVSFSIGTGASYGGLGTQTVIGKQGSGLLIGLGAFPGGGIGYNLGLQIVIDDVFYLNGGYGTYAFFQPFVGEKTRENSINFSIGGLISLGPAKKTFINLGIGIIPNHSKSNFSGEAWFLNQIHPTLGIVFRL